MKKAFLVQELPTFVVVSVRTERSPFGKASVELSNGKIVKIPNSEMAMLEHKGIPIEKGAEVCLYDNRIHILSDDNLTLLGDKGVVDVLLDRIVGSIDEVRGCADMGNYGLEIPAS